jgi:AcrR family transcriptional regulator
MEKKHAAIVDAARTAFLESSYAETSMDSIAKAAKVGIKTIYRHFEDKDDLFIAVIQAACQPQGKTGTGTGEDETPAWFAHPPSVAIQIAGEAYLRSILDKNQIALFRLMIRDAHKFPELASRYPLSQDLIEIVMNMVITLKGEIGPSFSLQIHHAREFAFS